MGMFDSILLKKTSPIKCPKCGNVLGDFQTKSLHNLLDVYKEGSSKRKVEHLRAATKEERAGSLFPLLVPDGTYHYEPHPQGLEIYAYDFCRGCETMVGQYFQFGKTGVLTRKGKPIIEGKLLQ